VTIQCVDPGTGQPHEEQILAAMKPLSFFFFLRLSIHSLTLNPSLPRSGRIWLPGFSWLGTLFA
jgi:hypothetical protein